MRMRVCASQVKMRELGVLGHSQYKLCCMLDHKAMLTVQTEKYGEPAAGLAAGWQSWGSGAQPQHAPVLPLTGHDLPAACRCVQVSLTASRCSSSGQRWAPLAGSACAAVCASTTTAGARVSCRVTAAADTLLRACAAAVAAARNASQFPQYTPDNTVMLDDLR
jgi:hypothetical protein